MVGLTNTELGSPRPRVGWFVGAFYNGTDDQTGRFVSEGIWENGYKDRYLDLVRSMRPGDRIAIVFIHPQAQFAIRQSRSPCIGIGH